MVTLSAWGPSAGRLTTQELREWVIASADLVDGDRPDRDTRLDLLRLAGARAARRGGLAPAGERVERGSGPSRALVGHRWGE